MSEQIVLLEFVQLAKLREYLLYVSSDDEVAIYLIAEAEQEVNDIDEFIGIRHGLEVGVYCDHGFDHLLFEEVAGDLLSDEACELPHRVVETSVELGQDAGAIALEANDIVVRFIDLLVELRGDVLVVSTVLILAAEVLLPQLFGPLVSEGRLLPEGQSMPLNKGYYCLFLLRAEGATLMRGEVSLRMVDLDLVLATFLADSPVASLALVLHVQQHLEPALADLTILPNFFREFQPERLEQKDRFLAICHIINAGQGGRISNSIGVDFRDLQQMIKSSQHTLRSRLKEYGKQGQKSEIRESSRKDSVDVFDCERTSLFFIKSKHVFREYRNHQYFQAQRNKAQQKGKRSNSQFVESPAPFGINNAYFYMRDQLSKNYLKRQQGTQFKTINQRYLPASKRSLARQHRRSVNLTLPNLSDLNGSGLLFKAFKTDKLPGPEESDLRQTNLPLQSQCNREPPKSYVHSRPILREHLVNIVYMNKFQALQRGSNLQLKVNIFSYILKTFLKTKVNYLELTNDQFQLILSKIMKIYHSPKESISLKGVINCKSVQEILEVLDQYSQDSSDYNEILRHFFIANQEVYKYQFNCIKDQMKYMINLENNCINHDEKIYVFHIRTGKLVTSLIELINNKEKFVVGIAENAYQLYKLYERRKNSKREAEERIKKWKSIVPNQTPSQAEFHSLSSQKYQTLFTNVQKKRQGHSRKPIASVRNGSFIDRNKLVRIQSIFQ